MIPDNAVTTALRNLEKSTSTRIAISSLPATENQTTHIERKQITRLNNYKNEAQPQCRIGCPL
jgi:hypothetical protein